MRKTLWSAAVLGLTIAAANADPVPENAGQRAPAASQTASLAPQKLSTQAEQAPHDWLDGVSGDRLVGVDGSTLSFEPSENGITRHMTSPDGAVHDTTFVFLNNTLGTVTDGSSSADVIGFFRKLDSGMELTFSDGHTETIAPSGDGIALTLRTPEGASTCMGWYPKGHAFSDSERRAALALYAKKLGLASPAGDVPRNIACSSPPPSSNSSVVAQQPDAAKPVASPAPVRTTTKRRAKHAAMLMPDPAGATALPGAMVLPATSGAELPPISTPVSVRESDVHPVDDGMQLPPNADPNNGASSCLTVDSDGGHWGFRNACPFDVAFSYCLRNASATTASCRTGAVTGIVVAKSFTPLLIESALAAKDAEHDFRWIACGQAGGAMQPHLDQTTPPQGRCIRSS